MADKVKPIPEGYSNVIPYLTMKDAEKAVEFYKKVFNAKEVGRITMPDGKVGHSELQIGNARIMLAEEMPEWGNVSPETLKGSPVSICIYAENVDEVFKKGVDAGAKTDQNMEPKDQFYGDRSGSFIDPFGHKWTITKRIEEVSFEEMQKRSDAMFANMKA